MEPLNAVLCERVRAFVSLELDDDVSELERSVLEAHTEDCRACREFRVGVTEFTAVLRAAPPEAPSRSIRLPRRPRRFAQPFATTAAAAAAAMVIAGLAAVLGPLAGDGGRGFELRQAPPAQPFVGIDQERLLTRPFAVSVWRRTPTCRSFNACPR